MRRALFLAAAFAAVFSGGAFGQDAPAGLEPSASAAAPADPPPSAWSAQIEAARARHDDWLACINAKRLNCDDKAKPDPMAALLNDDTLVEGDIVATPQGLKTFHGQAGTPHRREDFR